MINSKWLLPSLGFSHKCKIMVMCAVILSDQLAHTYTHLQNACQVLLEPFKRVSHKAVHQLGSLKKNCFLPPLLLFPLLDVTVFKAAWRSLVIAPADGAVIRVCAKETMSNCSSVFKSLQNKQKGLLHFLNHPWSAGPGHSNLCATISQIPKNPSISFWSLSLKPQELRLCPSVQEAV